MAAKRTVVIGLLGPSLDSGLHADRWERWRPSVALCQQEDLLVDRFELLFDSRFTKIARVVEADVHTISPETTVRPQIVPIEDAWDFQNVYAALHDFARAYPFAPDVEDYLIHITTGSHVAQICLFLLTESRRIPGKLLQTAPPRREGGVTGSFSIIDLDLSKYDRLAARFGAEARESASLLKSGIATRNGRFNALIEQIERVAAGSKSPILLMGPTGAGKSQLARQIYALKKQRRQIDGAFVAVNCATLRGDGAMSALFGHTRGAFTGAVKDRPGLLRAADGGVLFLDEIGELGPDEQAMLLRALEEKRFLSVGSDREQASDFQLIAGTNCDLKRAVAQGRFREDLLARIHLWTFTLPALRERREDIEPNLDFELERFAAEEGVKVAFNKEARTLFLQFATAPDSLWTCNFRDLNAAVVRMGTLAAGGRITVDNVRDEIARLQAAWAPASPDEDLALDSALSAGEAETLDAFDRIQLAHVVSVCKTSRSLSDAGRQLFSISRLKKESGNDADRLRKYLARFKLSWAKLRDDDSAGS